MERLVAGDVVVVSFPFSYLAASKKRPALVLNSLGSDVILCQITQKSDEYSIKLTHSDLKTGSLPLDCYIRPNKLFTAHHSIIRKIAGKLSEDKLKEFQEKAKELVST